MLVHMCVLPATPLFSVLAYVSFYDSEPSKNNKRVFFIYKMNIDIVKVLVTLSFILPKMIVSQHESYFHLKKQKQPGMLYLLA